MKLMLRILNIFFCGLDILVAVCLIIISFPNSFMQMIQTAITELLSVWNPVKLYSNAAYELNFFVLEQISFLRLEQIPGYGRSCGHFFKIPSTKHSTTPPPPTPPPKTVLLLIFQHHLFSCGIAKRTDYILTIIKVYFTTLPFEVCWGNFVQNFHGDYSSSWDQHRWHQPRTV